MDIDTLLLLLPIVLVSLTLHELAHAWVAWRLGDPTARDQGRLTLHPLVHLDPLGTLMFAVTSLVAGLPFGWAKPVPVHPGYFKRPKEGMAIVAAAGPVTNFVIALVCLAIFQHAGLDGEAQEVVRLAYLVNVVLGIFNLIPIPPLDGGAIMLSLVSPRTAWQLRPLLSQYGFFLIILLILPIGGTSILGRFLYPIADSIYAVLVG